MAWSDAARAAAAEARRRAMYGGPREGSLADARRYRMVSRKTMAGYIKQTRSLDPSKRGRGSSAMAVRLARQRLSSGGVTFIAYTTRKGQGG